MKQEGFQVVAELYNFLASFNSSAISAASKLPGISDNLRNALQALYQESANQQSANLKSTVPNSTSSKKRNVGSLNALELLMDKKRFPSKQALLECIKSLGITIKVDVRDSQERVARRIAAVVVENPTTAERLYDLIGANKDTQTAGWFDLIRRSP